MSTDEAKKVLSDLLNAKCLKNKYNDAILIGIDAIDKYNKIEEICENLTKERDRLLRQLSNVEDFMS